MALAQERLRAALVYDAETGAFTWALRVANCTRVGAVAGCLNRYTGYRTLMLDGKSYLEHHLAWLYVHGTLPDTCVDHIDGVKDNNAIHNLRLVTHAENLQNMRGPMKNNRAGFLGVSLDNRTGRYQARIRLNGISKALGNFADPDSAHAAYVVAKRHLHPKGTL